jgi:3' terminal RNA ribose 2'-O-methyltransferase Hen1
MLLTITTTEHPATDLGYLLRKNPARVQSFPQSFGTAHVFYPEATSERCTAALLLEVDPVGLVRNRRGPAGEGYALEQYVNDRPYVGSSFLSVAIGDIFGSTMTGKSKERPELAERSIPLEITLAVLPCRGGEKVLRSLFEPLGYTVKARGYALDDKFSEWGDSPYFAVTLQGTVRLSQLLTHLYVLIPVLDNHKHYWVGDDEVEKLLRRGEGWLASHPQRDLITSRYLKYQRSLINDALARLVGEEDPTVDARGLSAKRSLAIREFALGIEALERFVRQEPLRRVHECVFGVLALESEPVDPRL